MLLLRFFTNHCDLEYPKPPKAQGWVSVKMCLLERSKSVYRPPEKTERSISFLPLEFNKSHLKWEEPRWWVSVEYREIVCFKHLEHMSNNGSCAAVSLYHRPHFRQHNQITSYTWTSLGLTTHRHTKQEGTDFMRECFQYMVRNRYFWIGLEKRPHTSIQSTQQKTSDYYVSSEILTQIQIAWERKFSWKQHKIINKRSIHK